MKKLLKVLDNNGFLILCVISIIAAMRKGTSNEAVIYYGVAMAELILQFLEIILRKIKAMDKFYSQCELMNVEALKGIVKLITIKNAKEDK